MRQDSSGCALADAEEADFRDSYLARVGLTRWIGTSLAPSRELLDHVVKSQLATVPFENLDIHRGRVVDVNPAVIGDKILRRKRGGICYEVNGILARGLCALGFDTTLLGASVHTPAGELGRPLGHMAVLASAGDNHWLADAGFGGSSIVMPIAAPQRGTAIDVTTSAGRYRTDGVPRPLHEFAEMARWHSTSPQARFTGSVICSVTFGTCRSTLSRNPSESFTLTETDVPSGDRTRVAVDDHQVRALFADRFGITLTDIPVPAHFG